MYQHNMKVALEPVSCTLSVPNTSLAALRAARVSCACLTRHASPPPKYCKYTNTHREGLAWRDSRQHEAAAPPAKIRPGEHTCGLHGPCSPYPATDGQSGARTACVGDLSPSEGEDARRAPTRHRNACRSVLAGRPGQRRCEPPGAIAQSAVESSLCAKRSPNIPVGKM